MESAAEEACREYESINGLLKSQLPQYIALRVPMLDPILESLIIFQEHLFSSMLRIYQPLDAYVNTQVSVLDGYERRKAEVMPLLQEISILSKAPITSPPMPTQDVDEFDAESTGRATPPPVPPPAASSQPPLYPKPSGAAGKAAPPPPPVKQSFEQRVTGAVGGAVVAGAISQATGMPASEAKKYAQNDAVNQAVGGAVISGAKSQASASVGMNRSASSGATQGGFSYGAPPPAAPSAATKPSFLKSSGSTGQLNSQAAAPPPYQAAAAAQRPPPPPTPRALMAVALYDFDAQQDGDLSFRAGEHIEVVERTVDANGWWSGKLNGRTGIFPGNYVRLE